MEDVQTGKTPVHLWIVGAVAAIWNCFGAYDYIMTRMRDTDYLASMMPGTDPNAILSWIDSFPIWAQFGWGLGVWMGLLGSLLLLARSRYAVWAFGLSLVGMVLSFGYQFMGGSTPPEGMDGSMMMIMPLVIIAIGIGLFLYARAQAAKAVLR
jgi:hypothetical protein